MFVCMGKLEKKLERIENSPRNVEYKDLVTVLEGFGFVFRNGKGSHSVYTHPQFDDNEEHTLPRQSPLKVPYIKKAIDNINRIKRLKGERGDGE